MTINESRKLKTELVKAPNIKENDLIFVEGHLMQAKNIEHYEEPIYTEEQGKITARFTGICVCEDDNIFKTSYNGGRYGGNNLAVYARVITY